MQTIKAFGNKTVTRAPKGGFDHPVNGKSYKGGQFCPLYSVSGGSEEAKLPEVKFYGTGRMYSDPILHHYFVMQNTDKRLYAYEIRCAVNGKLSGGLLGSNDIQQITDKFDSVVMRHYDRCSESYKQYSPLTAR